MNRSLQNYLLHCVLSVQNVYAMKKIILFIIVFSVHCFDAVCCDCGRGPISVKFINSSDWIFIGTLLSEKMMSNYSYRKCIYKVTTAYKGVIQGDTIQIFDEWDVSACGLGNLTIGVKYLIYATGKDEKWTSRCDENSREPIFILPRDSTIINNIKTGRFRGCIDDTVHTRFHTDTLFLSTQIPKVQKNIMQKFYDEEGKIAAEGRCNNGLPDGFWHYYEHGELVEYGKYLNGKKDSLWVEQYGTSKYIYEFKNGEYTYRQTTFFNGKIDHKTEPVGNGKKWIHCVYHDNGRPRVIAYTNPPKRNDKGRLKDPVWDGPCRTFNKAGMVLDTGLIKNGLETGHWKYYYENGKLRMEGNYTEGKKSGKWKIYYPNKKIKAIGAYEKGEKIGAWKYYNENGNEILPNPELIKVDEDWFTYSGEKEKN